MMSSDVRKCGRLMASRPTTYFTSGTYCRISRSRPSAERPLSQYSCQSSGFSSTSSVTAVLPYPSLAGPHGRRGVRPCQVVVIFVVEVLVLIRDQVFESFVVFQLIADGHIKRRALVGLVRRRLVVESRHFRRRLRALAV